MNLSQIASLSGAQKLQAISEYVRLRFAQANADQEKLQTLMTQTISELKEAGLDEIECLRAAMQGANEALVGDDEARILELINEKDRIINEIATKQEKISALLELSFESAKVAIINSNSSQKELALAELNSATNRQTRLGRILAEAASIAILGIVERGEDVQNSTKQLIAYMAYRVLAQGEFSQERIIYICRTLILSAAEVAEASGIYSKQIISGAILGAKEAISRLIKRLKEESHFAPNELHLGEQISQLSGIDQSFIDMLNDIKELSSGETKEQIARLIKDELDNHFARLQRLSEQASEELSKRIEQIRQNPRINELLNNTNETISELSHKGKAVSKKLIQSVSSLIKK